MAGARLFRLHGAATVALWCLLPQGVPAPGELCKCQNTYGDWTVFGNSECGRNNGTRCLGAEGDWTTWGQCCKAMGSGTAMGSGAATRTRVSTAGSTAGSMAGSTTCDCSWTSGPFGCGTDDGSPCWSACCPHVALCDCNWANLPGGCGRYDGTACWNQCCARNSPSCNCDWARNNGCNTRRDGSKCWDHCCLAYGGPMHFWRPGQLFPGVGTNPAISVAALAAVAGGGLVVAMVAIRRRERRVPTWDAELLHDSEESGAREVSAAEPPAKAAVPEL